MQRDVSEHPVAVALLAPRQSGLVGYRAALLVTHLFATLSGPKLNIAPTS